MHTFLSGLGRERLAEELRNRVRERKVGKLSSVFTLDLRGGKWGNHGQQTIRVFGHPDWPEKGESAATLSEASRQLPYYAEWLMHGPDSSARKGSIPSWGNAVPAFLEALRLEKGDDHSTFVGYRGSLKNWVLPKWRNHPLSVSSGDLSLWLSQLMVVKAVNGQPVKVPMAPNTKRAIREAMRACWKHYFSDQEPSFANVVIKQDARKDIQRRADARDGVIPSSGSAYSPGQIRRILVAAAINDYVGNTSRPNVIYAIANTPDAIVWQIATLTRLQEELYLRWHGRVDTVDGDLRPMIDDQREGGVVYVPGTKNGLAPRWVMMWDAFRPWVTRMRRLSLSDPRSTGFIFQVPGRPASKVPPKSTYQGRVARAEKAAGLKWTGKNTHILRATGSTWLNARLPIERVKLMLGHSRAHGGVTDLYIDPEVVVSMMPKDVWSYMDGFIPHPDDVFSEASERLREQGHDVDLTASPLRLLG